LNDRFLNIKNPSCLVFPSENNYSAGDPFSVAQRADAERFTSYHSFEFKKSRQQKVADVVSTIAISISLIGGLFELTRWLIAFNGIIHHHLPGVELGAPQHLGDARGLVLAGDDGPDV
jgi:hypothetical protein